MKLKTLHLFLILLGVLLLSNLGFVIKEGFEGENTEEDAAALDTDGLYQGGGGQGGTNQTLGNESGQEGLPSDEYILKSSVVPPVCPKCPDAYVCPRQKPCPPCPACARCPEQPFTCKKVPDYNHVDSRQLPKPVLANFSSFSS